MAAEVDESHQRRWAASGLAMIEPAQGVRMLADLVLDGDRAEYAALPLVRERLPANLPPLLRELRPRPRTAATAAHALPGGDILQRLSDAVAEARPALLQQFLTDQVVRVLALGDAQRADPHRSLMDMGMDSLMAMELRNRIQSALKVQVSVVDLLQGPSLLELAGMVGKALTLRDEPAPAGAPAPQWEEGTL